MGFFYFILIKIIKYILNLNLILTLKIEKDILDLDLNRCWFVYERRLYDFIFRRKKNI